MKCWSRLSVGINIRSIFLFYYVLLMSIDRRAMWERTAYVMSPRFFDWKKSSTVVESFTSLIIGRYSFLMGKKKRKGDCKLNCENENDLSQITQWFIIRYDRPITSITRRWTKLTRWCAADTRRAVSILINGARQVQRDRPRLRSNSCSPRDNKGSSILI